MQPSQIPVMNLNVLMPNVHRNKQWSKKRLYFELQWGKRVALNSKLHRLPSKQCHDMKWTAGQTPLTQHQASLLQCSGRRSRSPGPPPVCPQCRQMCCGSCKACKLRESGGKVSPAGQPAACCLPAPGITCSRLTCDVRAGWILLQEEFGLLKHVHLLEAALQLLQLHHGGVSSSILTINHSKELSESYG